MLQQQDEDLWTVDHELRMGPGLPFPTRMTVVRLADGSLALISPVPIDDALGAELANVGPVNHLVAPNLLHHLHLAPAKQRYPGARIFGPPGLEKKQPGLDIQPLDAASAASLGETLGMERLAGAPKIAETVFFHRATRSLIVTELVFNVVTPPSWTTALLLACTGTRGRLAQSRVWRFATQDTGAFEASLRRVLAWDFDRLIVAHGDVIASGAKARLAGVLFPQGLPQHLSARV